MSLPLLLVLMTAATYRITRLVVVDTLPPLLWVRNRLTGYPDPARPIERWRYAPSWVGELVGCYWCTSVWIAAGVVGTTTIWASIPLPALVWAAVASGAAWLSHLEDYTARE